MSGGGKGGKETSKVEIPEWLEGAAQRGIDRGERIAQIGYVPYSGPNVAAMTDGQNNAMGNTNAAAAAFGMQGNAPMPEPETFAGGVQGYSSIGLYNEAIERLKAESPGQYEAIMSMFVDPVTGGMAGAGQQQAAPVIQPPNGLPGHGMGYGFSNATHDASLAQPGGGQSLGSINHDDGGPSRGHAPTGGGGGFGGYSSFGDMFDGGGPGNAGGAFRGGGRLSDAANLMTDNNSGGGFGGGK